MHKYLEYLPPYLREVREFEALGEATNPHTESVRQHLVQTYHNQYVALMEEAALERWERLFQIKAADGETLEFRKRRLINRFSLKSPITMRFLCNRLDDLLGEGNYILDMDYDNYTLYIESASTNQYWYEEIHVMLHKVKPANIVFTNRPRIEARMLLSEQAETTAITFNYRLGTVWFLGREPFVGYGRRQYNYRLGRWALGQQPFGERQEYNYKLGLWPLGRKPFVDFLDMEVIKMDTTPSLMPELMEQTAGFITGRIASVLLNDTYTIQDFTLKSHTPETATVGYPVPLASGLGEITNIKLLDENAAVLSDFNVYVPLFSDIAVHHKITVKEGLLDG